MEHLLQYFCGVAANKEGEYGIWTAFLVLLVRLFFYIPDSVQFCGLMGLIRQSFILLQLFMVLFSWISLLFKWLLPRRWKVIKDIDNRRGGFCFDCLFVVALPENLLSLQASYCMKTYRTEVPQFWQCDKWALQSDECDGNKKLSSLDTNVEADLLNPSRQKVSGFVYRRTGVFASVNEMNYTSRFSYKERKVDKGKTKHLSCDEAVNLSSGTKKWNSSSRAFKCGPILSKPVLFVLVA